MARAATRSARCSGRVPVPTRTERERRRPAPARRRASTRWGSSAEWVCVEPKRSKTVTSGALAGHHERVREAGEPVTLRPVQHHDRLVDDHAGRDLHDRAAGQERVVEDGERVGRRVGAHAEDVFHVGLLARCQPADQHALGDECLVERVVHNATVAHDDETGPFAGLGGHWASAGRGFVAGLAELLGREPVGTGRGRARRSGCSARSLPQWWANSHRRASPRPRADERLTNRDRGVLETRRA